MKKSGFTLIELLMVSVVLTVLAAIAIPNFTRMKVREDEAEVKSVVHSLQMAVEDYKTNPGKEGVKPLSAGDITYICASLLPFNVQVKMNPFNRPNTYGSGEIVGAVPYVAGQVGYMDNGTNPYSIMALGYNAVNILTLLEGQ